VVRRSVSVISRDGRTSPSLSEGEPSWTGVLASFKRHVERAPGAHVIGTTTAIRRERGMGTPAVAWFEVTGKDGEALRRFYGQLFGWEIQDSGGGDGYGLVAAAEKGIGGGIGAAQGGGEGGLTFYVEVDDPAEYLKKAEELGGQTIVPPTELPQFGLTFAFFADPEGHVVGLSKGAVQ
jgi:predicted enzyme related to lactoylglutathione lyase